jgi:hypothetical protein
MICERAENEVKEEHLLHERISQLPVRIEVATRCRARWTFGYEILRTHIGHPFRIVHPSGLRQLLQMAPQADHARKLVVVILRKIHEYQQSIVCEITHREMIDSRVIRQAKDRTVEIVHVAF